MRNYLVLIDIDDHVWRLPVELDGCLEWCRQLDSRSWWPCSRTITSTTTTMFCRLSFSSLPTLGQVGQGWGSRIQMSKRQCDHVLESITHKTPLTKDRFLQQPAVWNRELTIVGLGEGLWTPVSSSPSSGITSGIRWALGLPKH
ncbi:hypothetical protein E2C01_002967 [Portunus trituberculatus]|uniref:Uncharacterized protein n=1 Tax=Portunus trituberculatus TaxID=210409 RepID=A0A5B7CSA0_PORTR|nr:hypothetical protein [Portunus trituberculatus]